MNKSIGIALVVIGALLAYSGYQEMTSPAGELAELVTGTPPDRSMFKFGAGILLTAIGAGGWYRGRSSAS